MKILTLVLAFFAISITTNAQSDTLTLVEKLTLQEAIFAPISDGKIHGEQRIVVHNTIFHSSYKNKLIEVDFVILTVKDDKIVDERYTVKTPVSNVNQVDSLGQDLTVIIDSTFHQGEYSFLFQKVNTDAINYFDLIRGQILKLDAEGFFDKKENWK